MERYGTKVIGIIRRNKAMGNILLMFFTFMGGTLFGIVLIAVLSANRIEEAREEGYILGYSDCMKDRPPRVRIR